MRIAQNPRNNVLDIFGLAKADTSYQPTLTSAPPDWTLTLTYLVATPSISLGTGSYVGTQEVTISDSTAGKRHPLHHRWNCPRQLFPSVCGTTLDCCLNDRTGDRNSARVAKRDRFFHPDHHSGSRTGEARVFATTLECIDRGHDIAGRSGGSRG